MIDEVTGRDGGVQRGQPCVAFLQLEEELFPFGQCGLVGREVLARSRTLRRARYGGWPLREDLLLDRIGLSATRSALSQRR